MKYFKEYELWGDSHLGISYGLQDNFSLFEVVIMDNTTLDYWQIIGLVLCRYYFHIIYTPY